MKSGNPAAFTLVELLVVITIIGMLVALLIPAINSTREVARTATCSNNLRQLGLAAISYDTAKGQLPGYAQRLKRSNRKFATCGFDATTSTVFIRTCPDGELAQFFSWATMLLSRIERQDIWDQFLDASLEPPLRGIELFVCPSDSQALATVDEPVLSYVANTGAWDADRIEQGGHFLVGDGIGDTRDNGVFANMAYQRKAARLGSIGDGTATTIFFSENIDRSPKTVIPGKPPWFTWAAGDFLGRTYFPIQEQQFGMVWVVNDNPQPAVGQPTNFDQERINGNEYDAQVILAFFPNFARPASEHSGGVNIAFCDGHTEFVRDSIDYTVYQRLMTTNGRKCVDPIDHDNGVKPPKPDHPIHIFRNAPPLAESDYR